VGLFERSSNRLSIAPSKPCHPERSGASRAVEEPALSEVEWDLRLPLSLLLPSRRHEHCPAFGIARSCRCLCHCCCRAAATNIARHSALPALAFAFASASAFAFAFAFAFAVILSEAKNRSSSHLPLSLRQIVTLEGPEKLRLT
jgi:hypothetical protein